MRLGVLTAALVGAIAAPTTAQAATLVNADGQLTYTAAPGEVNEFKLEQSGDATVRLSSNLPADVTGCTPTASGGYAHRYECPGVGSVTVDAGDGNDLVDARAVWVPATLAGGSGDDAVDGGGANDVLRGDAGEDRLSASGGDIVSGGGGVDAVFYVAISSTEILPAGVSLNDVADDGPPGTAANVLSDVEDVTVGAGLVQSGALTPASVTLAGSAAANELGGGNGSDTIWGGAGNDTLYGYGGDDTLDGRDGDPDRLDCGAGVDVAYADQFDQVAGSCERIEAAWTLGASEDAAPTVAWTAVAARLRANGVTRLQASASDDRGVASVRFLDDDRVVCTDTSAPYTCDYRPRGEDVGRNTLVAVATDAAGQTASSVRAVEVGRFTPRSLSLRVRASGSRFIATGKLELPAGVRCDGVVAVEAKAGGKRLATRTGKLRQDCAYRVALTVRHRGTVRFTATFRGTDVATSKTSPTRSTR